MKAQKVLLIIDIQNDYFQGGTNPLIGSLEASLKAKDVLTDFRNKGLPIIHIQHIANRPGASFFVSGTTGADIHESVKPVNGEPVIVKHFPNSFRDTELLTTLKSLQTSELVICGMMTHMCVDATVRAAKDFGFTCTLIGDACATKDLMVFGKTTLAEDVQTAFLSALSYFYANVIYADNFLINKRF
ncbi:MAG: cysteine hydrolase family protein [Bacteroidota bacterium]|nr:cysteine hydrolase family protein [Bacteroidota bacterium]